MLDPDLIARFAAIVGVSNAITDRNEIAPHLVETRGLYHGASPLLLKPASKEEVAAILKLASETGTAIVPQSGNTGHVGGQTPRAGKDDVLLTLSRMNRVREIDTSANLIVVDAGCVLQSVHEIAEQHDRLFPLSLGSQGSCQIGGNLSTNAGGTQVLAYGNMRQLCLGLEVVLPTGEIWDGLRKLKKDNTGYDLRDLFIGAEGTLGVITGAVLKLFPRPRGHQVAFAGLASAEDALVFLGMASDICGTSLTGFELMVRLGVEFTVRHIPGVRDPLSEAYPWHVLIDISTSDSAESAETMLQALLEKALAADIIKDAAVATSSSQARAFWHMRESMSEAQKPEGGSIKHDVSVPISSIPEFMAKAEKAVTAVVAGARICAFGHMGDGNIHYNISQPVGADKQAFIGRWREVNAIVHGLVLEFGGSISAEHGIGQLKRDELAEIRPAIEMDLMARIKRAFDPAGIMNPEKVIRPQ
ncbi:FAD-binding oxidoreductase [Rhizobium sp. KVB221]|uniref:FAD-binding oxidoreductase n=1 Tax=Rhizobium setariae TaxID=2801340 RepID=A0A936YIB3_9HYPH|nr:FAD-binding oxidoreductase [Rhizobium setariae]MBL0370784.1 FAD-binding oxidoreductase [Rhizobium setariae]